MLGTRILMPWHVARGTVINARVQVLVFGYEVVFRGTKNISTFFFDRLFAIETQITLIVQLLIL